MTSDTVYDGFASLPQEDRDLLEEFERLRRKLWLSPEDAVEELYLLEWRIGTRLGELRDTLSRARRRDSGIPAPTEPMAGADAGGLDGSTGLFRSDYLATHLAGEAGRARRRRSPLSLLVVDVDRLACSEPEMRMVGQAVLEELRGVCVRIERAPFAVRTGGTEVVAVVPDLDLTGAEVLAQHVHDRVVHYLNGKSVQLDDRVTVSIGFAALRNDDSADTLLSRARRGLITAQRAGCNRVAAV
ncbi:MAG: diguanylate cyclase [Polyangiaceae bacterium]